MKLMTWIKNVILVSTQVEENIYQFKILQFSSSYLLLKSQNFAIFHTHKEMNYYDFIIKKVFRCVGINHALKGDLFLIIQELCVIPNDIILKHLDLGRPMIKMCIPHTLIDLGLAD